MAATKPIARLDNGTLGMVSAGKRHMAG